MRIELSFLFSPCFFSENSQTTLKRFSSRKLIFFSYKQSIDVVVSFCSHEENLSISHETYIHLKLLVAMKAKLWQALSIAVPATKTIWFCKAPLGLISSSSKSSKRRKLRLNVPLCTRSTDKCFSYFFSSEK